MDAKATGERIAQLRKQKRMTQRELAELLHVTNKAVSKWECGKNFPDLALLQPLARALDTSVSLLLGLEQEIPEDTVAVMSAISEQEDRDIKRSLYMFTVMSLLTGALLVAAYFSAGTGVGAILAKYPPVAGMLLLVYSAFMLEKLHNKFTRQKGYRWPAERELAMGRLIKLQFAVWKENLRGRRQ